MYWFLNGTLYASLLNIKNEGLIEPSSFDSITVLRRLYYVKKNNDSNYDPRNELLQDGRDKSRFI